MASCVARASQRLHWGRRHWSSGPPASLFKVVCCRPESSFILSEARVLSSLSPLPTGMRYHEGICWICLWCDIDGRGLHRLVRDWHTLNADWVDLSGHLKSVIGSQSLVSGVCRLQGWVPKGFAVCADKRSLWGKEVLISMFAEFSGITISMVVDFRLPKSRY